MAAGRPAALILERRAGSFVSPGLVKFAGSESVCVCFQDAEFGYIFESGVIFYLLQEGCLEFQKLCRGG